MKTRKTLTKFLAISMVLAALAADLSGEVNWLQPVAAQTGNDSVTLVSYASIGLLPGEKVRASAGNPRESSGTVSSSFSWYIAHESSWSSVQCCESEWKYVPVRAIRYSEISREDLKVDGEPGTRRAEVLVGVSMMVPAGSDPEDFPIVLEVLKDEVQSGDATQTDSKYRMFMVTAQQSKQIVRIGSFLPGEKQRYTLVMPKEEGSRPVSVTSYTYDTYGNLLKQTDPLELQPGDRKSFEIKRDDLRVAGDEKTGRLQVQTVIKVTSMDGSTQPVKLHVSMEHVDRTGSSSGGTYYTGSVTVSGDG